MMINVHFIFKMGYVGLLKVIDSGTLKRGKSIFDFEGGSFGEFTLPSCGFTEDVLAVVACHYSLGVTEDDCSLVAASALDVHEIGVRGGYKSFEFVFLLFGVESGV